MTRRSALAKRLPCPIFSALDKAFLPLFDNGFPSFAEEDATGCGGAALCREVPAAALPGGLTSCPQPFQHSSELHYGLWVFP